MQTEDEHKVTVDQWFPLNVARFRRECQGQPLEFLGMYVNLLSVAWENGCQLPDDEQYLRRISGATPAQWRKHRQDLANLFFPTNGMWSHNYLREQMTKAQTIVLHKRAAGIKGNAVRWKKPQTSELLAKISRDGSVL